MSNTRFVLHDQFAFLLYDQLASHNSEVAREAADVVVSSGFGRGEAYRRAFSSSDERSVSDYLVAFWNVLSCRSCHGFHGESGHIGSCLEEDEVMTHGCLWKLAGVI